MDLVSLYGALKISAIAVVAAKLPGIVVRLHNTPGIKQGYAGNHGVVSDQRSGNGRGFLAQRDKFLLGAAFRSGVCQPLKRQQLRHGAQAAVQGLLHGAQDAGLRVQRRLQILSDLGLQHAFRFSVIHEGYGNHAEQDRQQYP